MVTISENIIIGETISHAKSILRESAILLYGRKDSGMESLLPVVEIRSCMFFRQERCGRSFIKITIYDYWE